MRLTGSGLGHAERCAWPYRDGVEVPRVPSTPEQAAGTAVHAAIEASLLGRVAVVEPDAVDAYDAWAAWWREWPDASPEWQPERAFAYDPTTDRARVITSDGHRDYAAARPGEVTGTADAVRVYEDFVAVIDWKTGDDWARYTPPAAENLQLAFYALCAARTYGREAARIAIVRIGSDGVVVDEHALDADDLDIVAERIRDIVASVDGARPRPGTHCARCPAAAACPEARKAADAIVAATPASLVIADEETAGALYERLQVVDRAAEQARAALSTWGGNGGRLRLSDGSVLERREQTRRAINLDAVALAILELHGVAVERPPPRVSVAAIKATAKQRGLKVAPFEREVMGELEAAGAVREESHGSRWMASKAGK
jgi:hypothetical protein